MKSVLFGAFWAVAGILVTEAWIGPLLTDRAQPSSQQRLSRVHAVVAAEYVEPRDPAELARAGVRGIVDSLEDPYASFVGPEGMRSFREESDGTLVGIGAMLGLNSDVLYPLPGGPAEAAGLRPGDRFLELDGEDLSEQPVDYLLDALRGPEGSVVQLRMQNTEGTEYDTEITRGRVPTVTVGDIRMLDEEAGIAHVHVRSFARTTVLELDAALESLEQRGMRSLVLDLRFNRGGQLSSAVSIAARFLDGDLVCTLRDRNSSGGQRVAARVDSRWPDLPIVVLVNGWSASGSEVVAAALRDHGRAAVVGERTYGKGIYQHVYQDDGGDFAIKFTAGYYVTPSGRVLEDHLAREQAGRIEPDVEVLLDEGQSNSLQSWLARNAPPEEYRERFAELYPEMADATPPDDRQLRAATALLQAIDR